MKGNLDAILDRILYFLCHAWTFFMPIFLAGQGFTALDAHTLLIDLVTKITKHAGQIMMKKNEGKKNIWNLKKNNQQLTIAAHYQHCNNQ